MKKKKYIDYIIEIEKLRKKYNFNSCQLLVLQIASAFEIDRLTYEKLKEEFINGSKK